MRIDASRLRIAITDEFGIERHLGDSPYDLVRHAGFSIQLGPAEADDLTDEQRQYARPEDGELRVHLGSLSFAVVDGYNDRWLDALDALSGDYLHLAETFWSAEQNDFGMHVTSDIEADTGGASHLLLLDSLSIAEPFRGNRLGLLTMGAVMNRVAPGCAFAFGFPMKPGAEGDERNTSAKALTRYYEGLGFRTFGDCVYVNFAYTHFDESWARLLESVDV